jgi:hypothetical protein
MTKRKRQWLHAGLVALVSAGADVGAQIASGSINPTRVVIVGLVIGGLSRAVGAALAAMAMNDDAPDAESGGT